MTAPDREPDRTGTPDQADGSEEGPHGGAAPGDPGGRDADTGADRAPTMLEQMGGVSGLIYSGIPVVVFVLANAMFGLMPAIWIALGSAVAITVARVVRKEAVQPAISGFFGVAIAAFIAYRTGEAKGFFLFGIWTSVVYFSVLALSVLVRWPLAGVVWNALNGTGMDWRKDKPSRRGYDIATLALAAVFAARFIVQRWLYDEDHTGWLAFAKIAMGYPLYGLALLVVVWAVRRSDRRLKHLRERTERTDAEIEAELRAKYDRPAQNTAGTVPSGVLSPGAAAPASGAAPDDDPADTPPR
ncbi:hypothetical protein GCM10009676_03820 [Prauserella halophila]|uniref:DUF3159 domain-containing protein n=1 Tax=Prauserella halophila TaxID=185641 RepID=A0ABP4GJI1_9PSEU|nr:DUF3159 domain-containing protein [Prauserella halophila]MCP2234280.1 Protein of unknown function (DUF3159) [Prauserella halophila]